MRSSYKRLSALLLLASAVSPVLTAHAETEIDTAQLERLIQNANRVQLKLQKQLDSQASEITTLRGQVEQYSYQIKQLTDRQRQLLIDMDSLRSQSAQTKDSFSGSQSSAVQSSSAETTASQASSPSSSGSEKEDYQTAVDLLLKQKDYPAAIEAFKAFQTNYPDSEYIPNSHYWLGQLYYSQGQDMDAAKSFAAVIAYEDSSKRADALVKLADIAKRKNNPEAAKKYYQKAIDEYPNSSSAQLAQSALSNL